MTLNMIVEEMFRAGGCLFIAGIVHAAYWTAKVHAKGSRNAVLLKGFLWCAGIALIASISLGEPTCIEKDDPMYGGCAEYADDGYELTTEQRVANIAYNMTLLYVPVVIGAFSRAKSGVSREQDETNYRYNTHWPRFFDVDDTLVTVDSEGDNVFGKTSTGFPYPPAKALAEGFEISEEEFSRRTKA
jgi:hypothetical protein